MCIDKITKLVFDKTGIDVNSIGISAFKCATKLRIEKNSLYSIDEYYLQLIESNTELNALIEEIIVPETWFFRDPHAYEALVKHLKKNRSQGKTLRILSLPSSSGEEACTIAISLLENTFRQDEFTIDAIDISQKNIKNALTGIYRQNSFRSGMPANILQKYFTRQGDEHVISPEIKEIINFSQGNIFDAGILNTPSEYDAIFCRNMLIYFNSEKKSRAIAKITHALRDNGILLIGHSETGILPAAEFEPSEVKKSFAFTKKNNKTKSVMNSRAGNQVSRKQPETRPITRHSNNRKRKTTVTHETVVVPDLDTARQAADNGNLDEALSICKIIESSDPSCHCYALSGTILNAMNKLQDAEKQFRKAIFLDPHHYDSLLQLSLLMEKKGDHDNASLFRKRAQKYQADSR